MTDEGFPDRDELCSFNEYLLDGTEYLEVVERLENTEYERDEVAEALNELAEDPELLEFLNEVKRGHNDWKRLYEIYGRSFNDYRKRLESCGMIKSIDKCGRERDFGLTWLSRKYFEHLQNFDTDSLRSASD